LYDSSANEIENKKKKKKKKKKKVNGGKNFNLTCQSNKIPEIESNPSHPIFFSLVHEPSPPS
jgi:hypothetical protein